MVADGSASASDNAAMMTPMEYPAADPGADQPALLLPADAVLPDYGDGGLLGLVGGIRRWALDRHRGGAAVRVFWLIDGLGDAFLCRHGAGSRLHAHRQRALTSVFPTTTASAVTTLMTGLSPLQHGLTGWFIHDERFGGVLAPLPLERRGGGRLRAPLLLRRLFPYTSLYGQLPCPSAVVAPRAIAHSPFSRRHARGARIVAHGGLDDMVAQVAAVVAALASGGGGYVHAYYDRFDALSHQHGCNAPAVVDEFARLDAAFGALLARLAGTPTEVLVSADHGFIDSPPAQSIDLAAWPEVATMLDGPLFGERRAALCRVRAGAVDEFAAFVAGELGARAVLQPSRRLVQAGLLGPGPAHRRIAERLGTHAVLMAPGWTLQDRVDGEKPQQMLGVHGGLSADEMYVPLIHACCAGE